MLIALVAIATDIETGFTVDIGYMVSSMPASHESKEPSGQMCIVS